MSRSLRLLGRLRHAVICLAVLAATLFVVPPARAAGPDRPAWIPHVDPFLSSGFRAYRASACGCFDRWSWSFEAGLGLRWLETFQMEASFRSGGLWFPNSGHFPAHGFRVGARTALTPSNSLVWDDFYLRGGYTRVLVATARSSVDGVYLHPGWSYQPVDGLHIDPEIALEYDFGTMANLQIGLQLVVGYRF